MLACLVFGGELRTYKVSLHKMSSFKFIIEKQVSVVGF